MIFIWRSLLLSKCCYIVVFQQLLKGPVCTIKEQLGQKCNITFIIVFLLVYNQFKLRIVFISSMSLLYLQRASHCYSS